MVPATLISDGDADHTGSSEVGTVAIAVRFLLHTVYCLVEDEEDLCSYCTHSTAAFRVW